MSNYHLAINKIHSLIKSDLMSPKEWTQMVHVQMPCSLLHNKLLAKLFKSLKCAICSISGQPSQDKNNWTYAMNFAFTFWNCFSFWKKNWKNNWYLIKKNIEFIRKVNNVSFLKLNLTILSDKNANLH